MPAASPEQRRFILSAPQAMDCSLYRADEEDSDAEEQDLGDAKLLLLGPFQPQEDWSATQLEEFFDGSPAQAFFNGQIACLAEPGSKGFFEPQAGDYLACTSELGAVQMYYIYQQQDDGLYVLIREDEED